MFSDIGYIKLVSKIVVGYTSLIRQAYPYASIRYNAREKRIYMSVFIKNTWVRPEIFISKFIMRNVVISTNKIMKKNIIINFLCLFIFWLEKLVGGPDWSKVTHLSCKKKVGFPIFISELISLLINCDDYHF